MRCSRFSAGGAAALMLLLLMAMAARAPTAESVTCSPYELVPCSGAIFGSGEPSGACCAKLREQQPCLCQYMRDPSLAPYVNPPALPAQPGPPPPQAFQLLIQPLICGRSDPPGLIRAPRLHSSAGGSPPSPAAGRGSTARRTPGPFLAADIAAIRRL